MYAVTGDWKQRQAEAFFKVRAQYAGDGELSGVAANGASVRAAAATGLIPDLTPEAVDDLRPGEVLQLAERINAIITEAFALPGE